MGFRVLGLEAIYSYMSELIIFVMLKLTDNISVLASRAFVVFHSKLCAPFRGNVARVIIVTRAEERPTGCDRSVKVGFMILHCFK